MREYFRTAPGGTLGVTMSTTTCKEDAGVWQYAHNVALVASTREELGGLGLHASSSPAASPGGMAAIASQGTMLQAGLYLLVIGYILLHIPLDLQSCKSQFVLLLACLDCLMLFGHMWDRVPTLQVVLNCRLLYVCLLALFNTAMFLTWRDCTAVSYLRAAAASSSLP
jgi:hypothetical protein